MATLYSLAVERRNTSDKAGAEESYLGAIEEAKSCSDKLKLPFVLSELAGLYVSEKKTAAAEDCLRKSVAASQAVIANDQSAEVRQVRMDCAVQKGRLANVLRDEGKLSEAAVFYKEAIAENTSTLGSMDNWEELRRDYVKCLRALGKDREADLIEVDLQSVLMPSDFNREFEDAVADFKAGKFEQADKSLQGLYIAAVRMNPWKLSVCLLWRGISLLSKGDAVAAEKELSRSATVMQSSEQKKDYVQQEGDEWAFLAYSQMLNGKLKESDASYRKSLTFYPCVAEDFETLGIAYGRRKTPQLQQRLYEWAVEAEARNVKKTGLPVALLVIGSYWMEKGDDDRAPSFFERAQEILEHTPTSTKQACKKTAGDVIPRSLVQLGQLKLQKKQYDDAQELFRRAAVVAEKDKLLGWQAVALVCLGTAQDKQGKSNQAEDCFNKALSIAKQQHRDDIASQALAGLAQLKLGRHEFGEYESLYTRSVTISLAGKDANLSLGKAYMLMAASIEQQKVDARHSQDAHRQVEALRARAMVSLKQAGPVSEALAQLAILELNQGKFEDAEKTLNQVVAMLPPKSDLLPQCLSELGGLKMEKKQYQDAEALFKRAVTVAETNKDLLDWQAQSLVCLGQAQDKQGKSNQAEDCFNKALSIARQQHRDDIATQALAGLAQIKRAQITPAKSRLRNP